MIAAAPTYTMGNTWRIPASIPAPILLTMDSVVNPIAKAHGVSVKALLGPARHKSICEVRFEAMWALRQQRNRHGQPRWSLPQIGRFFNRDHTTVLNALRRHAERLADQQVAA